MNISPNFFLLGCIQRQEFESFSPPKTYGLPCTTNFFGWVILEFMQHDPRYQSKNKQICTDNPQVIVFDRIKAKKWRTFLKHIIDKNGSKEPAFLWQKFGQNQFGYQNRFKIHIRGCEWVKYWFNLFLFYPFRIIKAIFNRLNLLLSQKK